ncbi:MAG: hypothetical protein U0232_02775 [Thermomicrobiales bacterium]
MVGGLLLAAVLLSLVLSLATWRNPALWPIQILTGAILLALNYWLIWGGIGFITSAIAIVQFWRAFTLYRNRRPVGTAT